MIICNRKSYNFPCIYKLTCLKNGRIYVGQTKNFGRRMRDHARAVQNYNDRQMAVYQNCLKKGKPCELVQKDMSIFDKYDFSEYEQTKPEVIFDLDTFNPESSVGS